jgi:ribonuclease P protein component
MRTRHTLGRDRKVRRHADFQRIQSATGQAGRATTAHFVFLVARTPALAEGGKSRLGLVVTRKIGNAVVRNRIKRVCRECFRLEPDFLPPGVDVIVIARRGAEALGLAQVTEEWAKVKGALRHRARQALAQTPEEPHVSPGSTPNPVQRGQTPR